MKITEVKVFPVDEEKLKAYAMIVFDECFVVRDLKVISGTSGLFVAMPSKKRKDGTFKDVAHPLNRETRKEIEKAVIDEYHREMHQQQEDLMPTPVELPFGRVEEPVSALDPHQEEVATTGESDGGMKDGQEEPDDGGIRF